MYNSIVRMRKGDIMKSETNFKSGFIKGSDEYSAWRKYTENRIRKGLPLDVPSRGYRRVV